MLLQNIFVRGVNELMIIFFIQLLVGTTQDSFVLEMNHPDFSKMDINEERLHPKQHERYDD